MTTWLLIAMLATDLTVVKNEPNPERRCTLALGEADAAITAAREAYAADDLEKTRVALADVGESVDLAYKSLEASGKDPRRSPKHFKQAELTVRQLLRRLSGLRETMGAADRTLVDVAQQRAEDVHDALIRGIMGKKH